MNNIYSTNVPEAYAEAIWKMRRWGEEEESRNGPVLTSPDPVELLIVRPTERVLFDPVRDANPFFHVMEFVWMMAGSNNVKWIEQFNSGFRNYADTGTDILHGAYGHRWRNAFNIDQIQMVIDMLRADPTTRRAVIGMWDPRHDLSNHSDLPCNTSIMFRYIEAEGLNMTVINRSNDLIWGMLGANAVHMTYLHELIAHSCKLPIGTYRVISNNLHVYKNMPKFEEIWQTLEIYNPYNDGRARPYPLLQGIETYADLLWDCETLMDIKPTDPPRTQWMVNVAGPMHQVYMGRKSNYPGWEDWIPRIAATDWRLACEEWLKRREKE